LDRGAYLITNFHPPTSNRPQADVLTAGRPITAAPQASSPAGRHGSEAFRVVLGQHVTSDGRRRQVDAGAWQPSTEKAPEACQALELDRVMLRIPDRRRDGMQEICVIVGTRMPQLRECPVPREGGRKGGESRGLSQAAGSLNVHPS
jgi:hypothetical protein